ncbi:MAG: site-specific integrase [Acidimicrobiales bacterium]|nr:site-specific integrase [Acidimicrobiales bacterium]
MRGTKRKLREGVWELRVYVGRDPASGNPRQISKTFHGGSRAADDALRDLVAKHSEGRQDGLGVTFGQLLDRWLTECERLDHSPTTLRTYRAQIEQTIRPSLGKLRLTRLTPKHLDDLYGQMKEDGLSAKTIRNHHAIISSALHQAVRWQWVRENVAEMAKPPRVAQRRVNAPSVEDVRSIIDAAEDRDPRLAPLLMLAALTGMRRGELCGLRWTDVNLKLGELEVHRSIVVVPGGLAEKTTKTDHSRRVALDEVGVALLTRHRSLVDKWASEVGTAVAETAFVFSPYEDGSQPFRPDNVTNFFIRVRDSLDLPNIRLHDLRHFTATQLIGAGVDVRTVAGRLGHSDPSLTLRVYSHVIEERDRAAAAIMGNVLQQSDKPAQLPTPPNES